MDSGGAEFLHPWQQVTIGSGLMLHAPLDLAIDLPALRAEFAALDAATPEAERGFFNADDGWTSIDLTARARGGSQSAPLPGVATPALAHMPSVAALVARTGWTALTIAILRQAPRGTLPWHYDTHGLHLEECRLLVPIHAPAAAVTLIGDQKATYPAGTGWTGDFSFPHQVENPGDESRIILCLDVVTGPEVRRLLPAALGESPALRRELSDKASNQLRHWRAEQGHAEGYRARPN